MKKNNSVILLICLLLISTTSHATANFTSATGVFLVPNVSVNGTTNYESVTLQLDLSNGTFSVLDATPKDTSFSDEALETLTSNGLKVDFYGCASTGFNQVSCKVKVVSTGSDQSIYVLSDTNAFGNGNDTSAFDNLGREYKPTVTAFDKSSSVSLEFNLLQGVPAEVKFIFDDFDIQATSIAAFKPFFYFNKSIIEGNFRNISF